MVLSALSKLGINKESSWGGGATTFINLPIEPFSYSPITYELLRDQSLRGEFGADFGIYQGVFRVEFDVEGHVYPDEIGYVLLGLFGSVTTSGTETPYTHTFTMAQDPTSLAILDENGVQTLMMRGLRVSEFGITFNAAEDFLNWSASLVGKDYTTSTLSVEAASTDDPYIGWQASIELDSSSFAKVITFEATLTREASIVYTASNTQAPYSIYAGPMEAAGNMVIIFDSADDLNRYLNNTTATMDVTFTSGTNTFTFTSGNVSFSSEPAEISRDEVDLRLTLNWRCISNTTDSGPCRVILANNTSSY